MPIYTAATITANRPSTTIFTSRGIKDLSPCILNSIVVMGTPGVYQEAYDEYRSQIAAFLSASALGKTVTTHLCAYDLGDPLPMFLSIPPMYIKPTVDLDDDDAQVFLDGLKDCLPVKESLGKSTVFILNQPTFESALMANNGSDVRARPRPGMTTPEGVLIAATLQTMVSRFLQTQTYSAGEKDLDKTEEESMQDSSDDESDSSEEEESVKPRRGKKVKEEERFVETFVSHLEGGPVAGSVVVGGVKRKADVDDFVDTLKKKRLNAEEITKFQEDFKEIWEDREVAFKVDQESSSFQVSKAKPSPFPVGFNRGGVRDVPNEPGLLFPYFDRMLIPDGQSLISQFMATGFYKLLNSSLEGLGESLSSFLPRLKRLGDTDYGAVHSHMLLGVNLALQTQSRLFVIVQDGEYLGFTLHGYKYSVWVGTQRHKPRTSVQLSAEVCKLSSHLSAVKELSAMFSGMKVISSGEPEEVTEEELSSSAKVFSVMKKRVIDDVDEVEKQLRLLKFSEPFLPLDILNIKNAFVNLSLGDISSYEDKPKYLYAKANFSLNETAVLCSFGPEFISPVNQKGSTFRLGGLKELSAEEYAKLEKKFVGKAKPGKDGKEPRSKALFDSNPLHKYATPPDVPDRLVLPKKPTPLAIKDWIAFSSTPEIRMDPKERAGLHRCLTANTRATVVNFWKAASLYASSSKGLGKRTAEVGEDRKGKKKRVESSGGFLGLFGLASGSSDGTKKSNLEDVASEFLDAMDDSGN